MNRPIEDLFVPVEIWDTEKHYEKARQLFEGHNPVGVVIHHTWKPTATQCKGVPTIKGILNYHLGRGWAYIGYHFLITPDGLIYQGRPAAVIGAHSGGEIPKGAKRIVGNQGQIGICVVGDFDTEKPTPEALNSLRLLLTYCQTKYNIKPEAIRGHNQIFTKPSKTCPGKNLFIELFGSDQWFKLGFK